MTREDMKLLIEPLCRKLCEFHGVDPDKENWALSSRPGRYRWESFHEIAWGILWDAYARKLGDEYVNGL